MSIYTNAVAQVLAIAAQSPELQALMPHFPRMLDGRSAQDTDACEEMYQDQCYCTDLEA